MKFLNYNDLYFGKCLQLFNENCPEYFAENEREDYIDFLEGSPSGYFIGISDGSVVSAFGLISTREPSRTRLSWILVSPKSKGRGVGVKMMNYARETAFKNGSSAIDIAASHLSASFFTKFGAEELKITQNGWGPDMHRVDMEIKLQ